MRRKSFATVLALGALTLSACSDTAGPNGAPDQNDDPTNPNPTAALTQADREEILEILDESGLFQDDFGSNELSGTDGAQTSVVAAPAEEVEPTPVWARFRGRPSNAEDGGVTIEQDEETGLVIVTKSLVFDEGEFRLDITKDGAFNPTSKPLNESLIQQAALERLEEEVVDEKGRTRHWKLAQISPAQFVKTAEEERTVRITGVTLDITPAEGDPLSFTLDDPIPLLAIDDFPCVAEGDEVKVSATVENDNDANTPPTFVYLYFFAGTHAKGTWHRVLMTEEEGVFTHTFTVEQPHHGKIMVDGLDSQTFLTESEDDYRGNVWGIPTKKVCEPDDPGPPT